MFACPGYEDLNVNKINLGMFWNESVLNDMDSLTCAAKTLKSIVNRMEEVQKMI